MGRPTQVYSNNTNYFTNDRDAYCKNTPFEKRPKTIVCPQFQVPVGSGFILYGVNANIIQDNTIYDNWRSGVRLFWVPAAIRGDNDPDHQFDTSNGNKFIHNQFGYAKGKPPAERRRHLLGRAGHRQLLGRQRRARRARRQDHERPGDAADLPAGLDLPAVQHGEDWRPRRPAPVEPATTNPDPPGCTWFTTPAKPKQ